MYHVLSTAALVLLIHAAFSQSLYPLAGAPAAGIGYASGCISNEWSALNNPAGLDGVKGPLAASAYESVAGFPAFNRTHLVLVAPVPKGVAGMGFSRFGDALYREQVVTFGYSNRFGIAALGAAFRYLSYHTEGFGSRSALSFSFGGIADLTPWLKISAHIIDVLQPEVAEGEKLPTWIMAGVCMRGSEKVIVLAEIEKDIQYKPKVKAGIEYTFHKKFDARTGVNINPQAGFFGIGFKPGKFNFDYAYSWYPAVFSVHQVSIAYHFRTKK